MAWSSFLRSAQRVSGAPGASESRDARSPERISELTPVRILALLAARRIYSRSVEAPKIGRRRHFPNGHVGSRINRDARDSDQRQRLFGHSWYQACRPRRARRCEQRREVASAFRIARRVSRECRVKPRTSSRYSFEVYRARDRTMDRRTVLWLRRTAVFCFLAEFPLATPNLLTRDAEFFHRQTLCVRYDRSIVLRA